MVDRALRSTVLEIGRAQPAACPSVQGDEDEEGDEEEEWAARRRPKPKVSHDTGVIKVLIAWLPA
jgi:hypothetical protein